MDELKSVTRDQFETFLAAISSRSLREVARHWNKARAQKRMPSWADITSLVPLPHGNHLWCYRYDPRTQDFTGQMAGENLRKWINTSFWRGRPQDISSWSNYDEALQLMKKIVTTPLVFRSSGRLFKVSDQEVTGERIALPLADDGKSGDAIFGASDFVPPQSVGPVQMLHENVEWYAI